MSSHPHFRLKLTVIALTLLYSGLSEAAINKSHSNVLFPLYPRLNLYGGTGDTSYGRADVMVPLFGSTQAIVYTDVNGQIGEDDAWMGSLGLGTRDAINDDFMLGGYVFADRFKSGDDNGGNNWLIFNPGVEFMTNHWDGRINGYIPSGKRKKLIGTFFGDQVNQSGAITRSGHQEFIGHDQFNLLFDKIEEIGPGADIDFGYTFTSLKRLRVNAGTYYFNMSDSSDINGVEAGVEMPINNNLLLQFNDSYDNVQKNTAVVSVRFTLGGMDKSSPTPTVQDRMLDPIYRHLGSLGNNAASPVNTRTINTHRIALERDNIWFFNANSGAAFNPSAGNNNCTFEHPCIGTSFNQNNIGIINSFAPRTNFYFAPGTYPFIAPPGSGYTLNADSNRLSLYSGQSIYGRTSDYTGPASSATGLPTFVGGLDPQGNNILDSFALINTNAVENTGINILNADNVSMNNLQIGGTDQAQNYPTAPVKIDNSKNIILSNSNLYLNSDNDRIGENNPQSGVNITNASTANIIGNTISVISNGPQSGSSTSAITVNGGSTANIDNNTIKISGKNSQGIFGIKIDNGSTTTIDNNNITFDMTNARDGMTAISASNNSMLNVNNNIISMTLTKPPVNNDAVTAILARSGATVNSNGNTFTITSTSTPAFLNFGGNTGLSANGATINSSNDNFTFNNFGSSNAGGFGIVAASSGSNVTVTNDVFNLNMTNSTGIFSGSGTGGGTVTGSNNTFNFTGSGTKNCGDSAFFSGNGNTFTGTGVIC